MNEDPGRKEDRPIPSSDNPHLYALCASGRKHVGPLSVEGAGVDRGPVRTRGVDRQDRGHHALDAQQVVHIGAAVTWGPGYIGGGHICQGCEF